MKRIFERILFMVIGALIAFSSYFIGNISNDINAQGTQKDKIVCDTLHVKESIFVGNEHNRIRISASTDEPGIFILHKDPTNKSTYSAAMVVGGDKASIRFTDDKISRVEVGYESDNSVLRLNDSDRKNKIKIGNNIIINNSR